MEELLEEVFRAEDEESSVLRSFAMERIDDLLRSIVFSQVRKSMKLL
jgi:hypothetical protein